MRKCSLILLALLFLSIMAGCAEDKTSQSGNSEHSNVQKTEQASIASNKDQKGVEVIVKSNNQTSSQEKERVLNEISAELDTMIQDINSSEDVSDDDLNF